MPSRNVYQADQIVRENNLGGYRIINLAELSWIFKCPDCPYIMTALTEEGAEALEHMHMVTMPSIHAKSIAQKGWDESPLSELETSQPPTPKKRIKAKT